MSLLKLIKAQLGISNTPANNFTLDASADNGTMKLARGNAGATTQDILTVDASGNVLVGGNNLNLFSAKSLAASGYQKLPSELIIQWGFSSFTTGGSAVTFPIAFPTACLAVLLGNANGTGTVVSCSSVSQTGFIASASSNSSNFWCAIGH